MRLDSYRRDEVDHVAMRGGHMKARGLRARLLVTSLTIGTLMVPSATAGAGVKDGNCKLTGDGAHATGDALKLSIIGSLYDATGTGTLTTSTGDVYELTVVFINCRRDGGGGPGAPYSGDSSTGPNIAEIEGSATKNGVPGYEWAATIHDHGEGYPGQPRPMIQDDWALTVAHPDGIDYIIDYQEGGLIASGNFQVQT
jgi:hypothetical protein